MNDDIPLADRFLDLQHLDMLILDTAPGEFRPEANPHIGRDHILNGRRIVTLEDDLGREAGMLAELLQSLDDHSQLPEYVDEIMQYADARRFREISAEIVRLGKVDDSIGFELAEAIVNVEVGKTGIPEAYKVLQTYEDNREFGNAVIKLKNVLDSDENIRIISESEGITRQEVQAFFKKIALQGGYNYEKQDY